MLQDPKLQPPQLHRLGVDVVEDDDGQPAATVSRHDAHAEAHAAGIRVNPFWGDEVPEMERMLDAGVDGMLTNYPALLGEVLRERGAERGGVRLSPTSGSTRAGRRLGAVAAALRPRPAAATDTLSPPRLAPAPPGPLRQHEQSLTDEQRDRCLEEIDRDSCRPFTCMLTPVLCHSRLRARVSVES